MERPTRERGLFSESPIIKGKLLRPKIDQLMHPDTGIVGSALAGILDMIHRKRFDDDRVIKLKAEELAKTPELVMRDLYKQLGYGDDYFEGHQFIDVKNTANNPDHLQLHNYPHEGCGKVEPRKRTWRDCFAPEIGNYIVQQCPLYFLLFGSVDDET